MAQLWEWVGTDQFGKTRTYQTSGPDVSESAMLTHLRASYHKLVITALCRIEDGQRKPPTGYVQAHAFQYGILDAVRREMGIIRPDRPKSILDQYRRGVPRQSILGR